MNAGLPSGLWDLTISRLSTRTPAFRPGRLGFAHSARHNAQPAYAPAAPTMPPTLLPDSDAASIARRRPPQHSLSPRPTTQLPNPLADLESRIDGLKAAAQQEIISVETPVYSEDALMALYEDLLSNPDAKPVVPAILQPDNQHALDLVVVQRLEQQLVQIQPNNAVVRRSPLLQKLMLDLSPAAEPEQVDPSLELHHRVLKLADGRLQRLGLIPSSSTSVPIPLFALEDYKALTRFCLHKGDLDAAESVLQLMRRSGMTVPEESLTSVLQQYSDIGDATGAEHCLARYLSGPPTEPQRHLHVRAHLRATPRDQIPETALTVLHSYETQNLPAPMQTYSSTIDSLYSTNLSIARAQAWDLFSHMRYVAHPKPDLVLYTAMIRACGSPIGPTISSEPERALDLWHEMTVEQKIAPTVGSYNAIILACARSGRKLYVNEAFRIAKEMLDSHRDAQGRSAYLPDRKTLCALLEGAKRIGDLPRARWILADLVRSPAANDPEQGVNEEVMMHVFQTYVSYVPPFTRHLARIKASPPASSSETTDVPAHASPPTTTDSVPSGGRFTHIPPQTASEVVEEADILFSRILEGTGKQIVDSSSVDAFDLNIHKFERVEWTPRLVNSYLSVHFQHSSFSSASELFWLAFDQVGVAPDARCLVEALERCSTVGKGVASGRDRAVGLNFAHKLWARYHTLETFQSRLGTPLSPRLVERAHAAYIRVLALNSLLSRALSQLSAFVRRFPASAVRKPSPRLAFRSTRTVLVGARPLVRLRPQTEVPDDDVPPLLLFDDLELLHHRLAAAEPPREKDIANLKFICKSYEWALRRRREQTLKAEMQGTKTPAHI
ncbi:hypothetical protein MKEN_01142100 [Mycena kentingensis (nom. inval.)]|nr:hypothetical protein MKEN_01142100 [Mycena kentingensis (nom. inval.)]